MIDIPDNLEIIRFHEENPKVTEQLETLFSGKVHVYIDYANVRPWSKRLAWHIDLKRLKKFFNAFENISVVKFYYGTLEGDAESESRINDIRRWGYHLRTKPVKIMNISIDASSVNPKSPDLLKNFIRDALLKEYTLDTVEYLNKKFKEMNDRGVYTIKDKKCNFDVEIGSDMLIDNERNKPDTFVLWSGDSDFHDPVKELLSIPKKVILFSSARLVSSELNDLKKEGLIIFDIRKIRDFICWKRELKRP